jgi:glycosyltransferase 2 family protein
MDRRAAIKAGIGYAVAAACLVWVFHDVRWASLRNSVGRIEWGWICLAVVFDVLSYVCQGARWALLLRHIGKVSTLQTTQAIYAGLFVNEMLPLRAGEILRAWLAARRMNARLTAVIPSILVERFFDAIWLAMAVGLTVLFVPLPRYLVDAEEALAGIVFFATAIFLVAVLRRRAPAKTSPGRLRRLLDSISGGIAEIGRSKRLYASFGLSGLLLLLQTMAYLLVLWGCGMMLSFWHGAAVLLILRLGTALPSAPSNVGTYQFFTVLGLTLFGVDKTAATGFSVVVFLILTVPLWAIGGLAFARSGLTLRKIRSGLPSLEEV